MQLARFPFTVIELHDHENPPTRPGKGGSRKVRGPRKGKS
jgi:hypothetical protein